MLGAYFQSALTCSLILTIHYKYCECTDLLLSHHSSLQSLTISKHIRIFAHCCCKVCMLGVILSSAPYFITPRFREFGMMLLEKV